jgi:hypothetical protein
MMWEKGVDMPAIEDAIADGPTTVEVKIDGIDGPLKGTLHRWGTEPADGFSLLIANIKGGR